MYIYIYIATQKETKMHYHIPNLQKAALKEFSLDFRGERRQVPCREKDIFQVVLHQVGCQT